MCGRYTLATPADELAEAFDLPSMDLSWLPRYNIAPGQPVPVIAQDRRGRRIGLLEWGFVPGWADEPGRGHINARSESVASKATFREAYARRRCLVPADGFYEWHDKVPHWIRPVAGGVITFAGIWERWSRPGAPDRHTMAILTTEANEDVRGLHDRMPVLVAANDHDVWLERSTDTGRLGRLLRPAPPGTLVHHPVSRRVNRTTEDDAGLIDRVNDA